MKVEWNALIDRTLVNLINRNLTYKEAAALMTAEFDMPFTKNSCIGRHRRLKMSDVLKAEVTIYDLRDGMCKWPLGKPYDRPPFMYCGEPTRDLGCSWCPDHQKKCFSRTTSYASSRQV